MRDRLHRGDSIAEDSLHTGWIHVDQHENSRVDTYDVNFDRPAQMATVTKKSKHGTDTRQFVSHLIRLGRCQAR